MTSIPFNLSEGGAAKSRDRLILGIGIVAACAIVAFAHAPALTARALYLDDGEFIIENPLVLHPSIESARRFMSEVLEPSTVSGYYLPLSMISLMLDVAMGGGPDHPAIFHRTSLVLHLVNTALIILILHRLFKRPVVASVVGLLFGAHPLTVEPIAWLGERKTLLCTFFFLASILAYLSYTERRRGSRYAASLALFVLALLSKPTCTPMPLVLLLIDWWPLGRLTRKAVVEKIPFLAVAALFAAITLISHERTSNVSDVAAASPIRAIFILCHNIIYYLHEIVWPRRLQPLYLLPNPLDLSNRMVLIGVIGTAILIPAMLVSLRWTRAYLTGWLIFFVAIFPTLGVVQFTEYLAWDKYVYLPAIGLLLIVAWALCRAADGVERLAIPYFGRLALYGGLTLLIGLEILGTRRQLAVWQDSETLVHYALAHEPRSGILHHRLGGMLEAAGKPEEAFKEYETAVRLMPNNPFAQNSLALALAARGRDREAADHFKTALRVKHIPFEAHYNYGVFLAKRGRRREAIEQFQAALQRRPDFTEARVHLANALADEGRFADAVEDYRAALKNEPNSANVHNNLGTALRGMGHVDEAIAEYQKALAIDPRYASSMINLANALRQKGRLDEAIEKYRAAIALDSSLGAAHFNIGTALFEKKKYAEAEAALREAVRLLPKNADVHFHLGTALEELGRKNEAAAEYREALRLKPDHAGARNRLKAP